MENKTKPLKDTFLDSTVRTIFSEMIQLDLDGKLPSRIYLDGLDPARRTLAATNLSCKLQRHGVYVYTQEVNGAVRINLGRIYGNFLAKAWLDRNVLDRDYAVAEGFDSEVREGFSTKLSELTGKFIYSEPQFPNSLGKITVDLEEFANYQ